MKKIAKECSELENYYLTKPRFFSKEYNSGENKTLYQDDSYKKACGDIFEIFSEFFFRFFETDEVFGCKDGTYQTTNDSIDLGCDGEFTLDVNNSKAFMQAKYRNNPKEKPFNKDVFAALFMDASVFHGFDIKNPNERLIFITNLNFGKRTFPKCGTSFFQKCIKKMDNQIILIGESEIKKKVDGHQGFWKKFKNFCNK